MKDNPSNDCVQKSLVKNLEIIVINQVKIYQDARFIQALNIQEKVQKELVGR